jgi:hypothetical protein
MPRDPDSFLSGPDQVQVLLGGPPKREFDGQLVLDLVNYWQWQNHAAHVSHRK